MSPTPSLTGAQSSLAIDCICLSCQTATSASGETGIKLTPTDRMVVMRGVEIAVIRFPRTGISGVELDVLAELYEEVARPGGSVDPTIRALAQAIASLVDDRLSEPITGRQ